MTTIELQEKIAACRRQINALEARNTEINRFLRETEDGSASLFEASNKWERSRSDCYDSVRMSLDKLDSHSTFRDSYLRKIDSILESREAEAISENYHEMKKEITKSVTDAAEELETNKRRIQQLQEEMMCYNSLIEAEKAQEVTL